MARYLTEFVGTFFLVLTIGLTVAGGSPLPPLAIGLALMVMVYMGGHISGAHYNPAVTIAVLMRGRIEVKDVAPYVIAQIAGSLVAALAVKFLIGKTFAPAPGPSVAIVPALLVEVLFTFALALVVLNVATAKKTANNSYYGAAIGMTVTAAAFAGGPISGGAFNPAVGIGPTLVRAISGVGGGGWQHLWLYIVGPVLGAVLAAAVFKFQEAESA